MYSDDISDAFLTDLASMCVRLDCDDEEMALLMLSESNMSAAAVNPHGHATGEIQFDVWAKDGKLQMPDGTHLRWQDLAAMSDDAQLKYVEEFFRPYKGKLRGPGRLYGFCFIPVAAAHPSWNADFVVCGSRPTDPFPKFYADNPAFDVAKKGFITAQDLQNALDRKRATSRGKEILSRLADLAPPTTKPDVVSTVE